MDSGDVTKRSTSRPSSAATDRETAMSSSYWLGLFFIFTVSVVWSASSVLIQFIYAQANHDDDNDNNNQQHHHHGNSLTPFLVTYVGVSLFTILLPIQFVYDLIATRFFDAKSTRRSHEYENAVMNVSERVVQEEENEGITRHSLNHQPDQIISSDSNEFIFTVVDVVGSAELDESERDVDYIVEDRVWTREDYVRTSIQIAPVWFIANWAYNASLAYTTVTSSTVLASTSSLFTFIFALLCRDETFAVPKLLGVVLGVSGSVLTAFNDQESGTSSDGNNGESPSPSDLVQHQQHPYALLGDMLGIVSAVGYALYAVQARVLCPRDESLYQMQTVLGYIGLICMVALSPIAIHQLFFAGGSISWVTMGFLVLKGLLDNVLSDYLWLRAVMLTNATVATVGLGLTIPLAFMSDIFMGNGDSVLSIDSLVGAVAVLIGFVFVNVSDLCAPTSQSGPKHNESGSNMNRLENEHTPLSTITDISERSDDSAESRRTVVDSLASQIT